MSENKPTAYLVMGICGSGKSTVAEGLAKSLRIDMLDADDFHPASNVAKMESGTPLTDEDRAPWLARLNQELRDRLGKGTSIVLACSALKQRYREVVQAGLPGFHWIYLKGSPALIKERMRQRVGHFMPPGLVDSQLETLEEPDDALVVDIAQPPERIVEEIIRALP